MSRIEAAMEKAARLRQGAPPSTVNGSEPTRKQESRASEVPDHPKGLSPSNPFLVSLHVPYSPAAEEYRKLKSALVKMTKGERFRNAIMVTSSVPSEGKSLTALNLAISLARELDHTVLLIDADLRRPSLHRYLEIGEGAGLSDLMLGEAEIAQTIVATGIGSLSVMRAGRQVPYPSELFSSKRMKELVEEMKHRYPDRYLIFDTPPALPFAETPLLAHLVDGVVFVVMERLAPQPTVHEALELLKGSELLGLVYNAADLSGNTERYSYYHNHSDK
jgi:protein-tyrosine kinase